jgi:hypothetical protein
VSLGLIVICEARWCFAFGREWLVELPEVQPGLVAMPILRCTQCGCEPVMVTPPHWQNSKA